MRHMLSTLLCTLVLATPRSPGLHNQTPVQRDAWQSVEIVDVCQVLGNPQKYDQKNVCIIGGYQYGFELAQLICPGCPPRPRLWVGFGDYEDELDKRTNKFLKHAPKDAGLLGGEFCGMFQAHGLFGSAGAPYKVDVMFIRSLRVLYKGIPPHAQYPPAVLASMCPAKKTK